jgi:CheY-like chemotaxis protein
MNLVLNAAESIQQESGRVTVGTGSLADAASAGPFLIGGETLGTGTYVFLSVTDTGVGMDDETLAQIFDPFFSTKGSGRGLGLSAALGIVRAHQGAIAIDSTVDGGSRFRVLFPTVGGPSEPVPVTAPPTVEQLPDKVASSEILVIDDETAVREATSDMLRAAGLTVHTADSGQAGIDQFRVYGADIGVVLLDMQMPGMNGERTFDGLKELDEGVRVVLMSGYSESEATQRFMGRGLLAFLQKPFDYDTLVRVVVDALDAGSPRG